MKTATSKIIIKNSLNNIKDVMNWIKIDLKPLFQVENRYQNLKLCLQEAVTNSIIHGNQSDEKRKVKISYFISDTLKIEIEDEGNGVALEKQNCDIKDIKKEDIFKESGRGLMLMKHFCDEVIFDKNKTTLIVRYK